MLGQHASLNGYSAAAAADVSVPAVLAGQFAHHNSQPPPVLVDCQIALVEIEQQPDCSTFTGKSFLSFPVFTITTRPAAPTTIPATNIVTTAVDIACPPSVRALVEEIPANIVIIRSDESRVEMLELFPVQSWQRPNNSGINIMLFSAEEMFFPANVECYEVSSALHPEVGDGGAKAVTRRGNARCGHV